MSSRALYPKVKKQQHTPHVKVVEIFRKSHKLIFIHFKHYRLTGTHTPV